MIFEAGAVHDIVAAVKAHPFGLTVDGKRVKARTMTLHHEQDPATGDFRSWAVIELDQGTAEVDVLGDIAFTKDQEVFAFQGRVSKTTTSLAGGPWAEELDDEPAPPTPLGPADFAELRARLGGA